MLSILHFSRTTDENCDSVQQKIVDQINAWDNEDCGTQPGDTEPHGQKCLYKVRNEIKNPSSLLLSSFSIMLTANHMVVFGFFCYHSKSFPFY